MNWWAVSKTLLQSSYNLIPLWRLLSRCFCAPSFSFSVLHHLIWFAFALTFACMCFSNCLSTFNVIFTCLAAGSTSLLRPAVSHRWNWSPLLPYVLDSMRFCNADCSFLCRTARETWQSLGLASFRAADFWFLYLRHANGCSEHKMARYSAFMNKSTSALRAFSKILRSVINSGCSRSFRRFLRVGFSVSRRCWDFKLC